MCPSDRFSAIGPNNMSVSDSRFSVEGFFTGREESRRIFDAVRAAVWAAGPAEMRVSKSQISFRRRRMFAWAWIPGQYLRRETVPLVLTLAFRRRDSSPRWKEVVEPYPGRFTHHLELSSPRDVDDEVRGWIREAMSSAG